jgi:hypothetical protein
MSFENILFRLDEEISLLQRARALLTNTTVETRELRIPEPRLKSDITGTTPKKRALSPAARKRMADAQRRRWAALRKPTIEVVPPHKPRAERKPRQTPSLPRALTSNVPTGPVVVSAAEVSRNKESIRTKSPMGEDGNSLLLPNWQPLQLETSRTAQFR